MLVVGHEMNFLNCDRVIFMDNGKIIEEGTLKKIFCQKMNVLNHSLPG